MASSSNTISFVICRSNPHPYKLEFNNNHGSRDIDLYNRMFIKQESINEFEKREQDFLNDGGAFIVPCPEFKVISK